MMLRFRLRGIMIGNVSNRRRHAKGAAPRSARSLSHFETANQLWRSDRHGCA
jgi:hypothetical protein